MPDDKVDRFIAGLKDEAMTSHFMDLAEPAVSAGTRTGFMERLRSRTAARAGALVLTLGAIPGVALAAEGFDPAEAIADAFQRAAESDTSAEVVSLLEDVAGDIGDTTAQAALIGAADRTAAADAVPNPDVLDALKTYLAANVGDVDGSVVSDLARQIGGPPDDVPAVTPPGRGNGQGPPDSVPPATGPGGGNGQGPPDSVPPATGPGGGAGQGPPGVVPPTTTP